MPGRPRLTEKMRAFVQAFVTNGERSDDAYRTAYPDCKLKDSDVRREAGRLLKHPLVANEIASIRGVRKLIAAATEPPPPPPPPVVVAKEETTDEVMTLTPQQASIAKLMGTLDEETQEFFYSKAWVLARLEENRRKAMQAVPVLDNKGNPTGMYVYQAQAANKAIETIARIQGHLVDRRQIDFRDLTKLTDDEIAARRARVRELMDAEEMQFRVIEGPAPGEGASA